MGGNARTAIICTLSPAHSHVEQSKSTLVFANCARNISTHAQVNVVTSGKALVQQLRREIARLENEVRTLSSLAATSDTASTQKETEIIEKVIFKHLSSVFIGGMCRESFRLMENYMLVVHEN